MSYEPTNWKDGDLVTSAKLNKIEQGIAAGGGVLIVHYENGTLDKTWQEIHDADACIIHFSTDLDKEFILVEFAAYSFKRQNYIIITQSGAATYVASSPDDYPTLQISGEDGDSNLPTEQR